MSKKYFEGETANELYINMIRGVSEEPQYKVAPRGMAIKETIGAVAVLKNPRECVITLKDRKLNYAFATIEKMEYLTGQTNPDRLVFYNSNFENYRSEYGIFDGAYPERLGYWYRHIYNLLKTDPDSRQAVMTIYSIQDRHKSKDIPCTLSFQFLIREGKLNMIATMRSNDLLWGFPYDISGFCFVQEALAACLGVELGTYELHAGSLHIYTEREEQLTKLLLPENQATGLFNLPVIPRYESIDEMNNDLRKFWVAEHDLRIKNQFNTEVFQSMPEWLKEYFTLLEDFVNKKYNKQLPLN